MTKNQLEQFSSTSNKAIHIATSVCSSASTENFTESRENAAILLKSVVISALLYNVPQLTFHLFLQNYVQDSKYFSALNFYWNFDENRLNVKMYLYSLDDSIPQEYKQNIRDESLYCLYNRLFLASMLANVDAVIYFDNSMILVENIAMFWDQFRRMQPHELMGIAIVPEPYATQDHNYTKEHIKGMDSNLLFMNLTRMRRWHWETNFWPLYQQGSRQLGNLITDRQLVDILLYYGTELVMPITCQFNFILSQESCCAYAENDTFGIRAIRPDFNSTVSTKTFQLIQYLVNSTDLRELSTASFQETYMKSLRQLVWYPLGNETKVQAKSRSTEEGDFSKKYKCEFPMHQLIYRQFFGI